jgi:hypothetical protein
MILKRLEDMICDKSLAIVGNSESILSSNAGQDIDGHDLVLRMNRGYVTGKSASIGSKTDIVAMSLAAEESEFVKGFPGAKAIMWTMPPPWKYKRLPEWVKADKRTYMYPVDTWQALWDKLGHKPSTGCMVIDFIHEYTDPASVSIYGFDNWATKSWYIKKPYIGPHSPEAEKAYIEKVSKARKVKIY